MEITSSFCINSQIIELSFDPSENKLIQGVVYDPENHKLVHNVTRKSIFDLEDPEVSLINNVVFINKPSIDITVAYKINENNTISRINHLYIKQSNGKVVFLYEKNLDSYYSIMIHLNSQLIDGVFVNFSGTIRYLKDINWVEEFAKLNKNIDKV